MSTTANLQLKQVPLSHLKPYPRNAKERNEQAVDAVAESITRYGYNQPIVVDADMVIIVGHTRYFALQKLGIKKASVLVTEMDKARAAQYRIVDNSTNELAPWNYDNLIPELREWSNVSDDNSFFMFDVAALINDSVGGDYQPTTQEEYEDHEEKLESSIGGLSDQTNDYIDFPCPHCGEMVSLRKSDLL